MAKPEHDEGKPNGGMSRAAKKRAKKKRQQEQKQFEAQAAASVVSTSAEPPLSATNITEDRPRKKSKKQKKRNKESSTPPSEDEVLDNLQTEANDETGDIEVLDTDATKTIDQVIHKIVSQLTPAQILLLQEVEDKEMLRQQEEEGVDLQELLQEEITSQQRASALFQSLLGPTVTLQEFYKQYWEHQPLLITRDRDDTQHESRLNGLLSLSDIRQLLNKQPMYYGKDLNVTKYCEDTASGDGTKRRLTLDLVPDKKNDADEEPFVLANASDVWNNYQEQHCTIRLLCPHLYSDPVHTLLSTLELEWGCMVGANVYLTPPQASQGFAPHYDDIEAFILQLEGYKHWKVYAPLDKASTLPRFSSKDFTEKDLEGVEPVLDVILGPGDLLYMPRGWIHQACTIDNSNNKKSEQHSLHLTVSAMQQWAWTDFLELLLPEALEAAASSDTSTSLREGLPRRFLDYMGAVYDSNSDDDLPEGLKQAVEASKKDKKTETAASANGEIGLDSERDVKLQAQREQFREEARKRIMRVSKEALSMLDAACDQIGKRFLSDRQPPALTPAELAHTSDAREENGGKVWPNTLVRLARPGIARLAVEDNHAVLYHCVDNSRMYQGNPLSPLEFELDDAPALEVLLTTVEPHWIQVQDLIHDDIEDKIDLAQSLYDEGILAILQTAKPDKSIQTN